MSSAVALPPSPTPPRQMALAGIPENVTDNRAWNPANSDRLEKVLTQLVSLAHCGKLIDLRPATLQYDLKGEFEQLYHAAFHRVNRPAWAVKTFPNGFSDLVSLINDRLSALGSPHLINTKKQVPAYKHLTAESLQAVTIYRDMYLSGEITRDDAIRQFSEDYGVTLSPAQIRRLLPNELNPAETNSPEDLLSSRKNAIREKLNLIRRELQADFSIEACLRGLVFEGFVGAYLSSIHGAANIESQKRFPILYTDMDGGSHAAVYTDFCLKEPREIYEVKLQNDKKNILTSAIAQAAAVAASTGEIIPINVVYRNPNPEVLVAVHENVSLKDEIKLMGLEKSPIGESRIQSIMRYISIESIFGNDQEGTRWAQRLSDLEAAIVDKNTLFLRSLAANLNAIGLQPGFVELQLDRILDLASKGELLDEKAASRVSSQLAPKETVCIDERIKAVINQRNKALDKLILEICFQLNGKTFSSVNEEVLLVLESASAFSFEQATLEALSQRESAKIERASKKLTPESFGEKLFDALVKNIRSEAALKAARSSLVVKEMFGFEYDLALHHHGLRKSIHEQEKALRLGDPTLGARFLAKQLGQSPTDHAYIYECAHFVRSIDIIEQNIIGAFNKIFCSALTRYTANKDEEVLPLLVDEIEFCKRIIARQLKHLAKHRIAKKLVSLKKEQEKRQKPLDAWLSLSPMARALDREFNLVVFDSITSLVIAIDKLDKISPLFAVEFYFKLGQAIRGSVQHRDQILETILINVSFSRSRAIFLPLSIKHRGAFLKNQIANDADSSANILTNEMLIPALDKLNDNKNHSHGVERDDKRRKNPLADFVKSYKNATEFLEAKEDGRFEHFINTGINHMDLERSGLFGHYSLSVIKATAPSNDPDFIMPEQMVKTIEHLKTNADAVFAELSKDPQYITFLCTDLLQMRLELAKALAVVNIESARKFMKESDALVSNLDTSVSDVDLSKVLVLELAEKQKQLFISIVLEKT